MPIASGTLLGASALEHVDWYPDNAAEVDDEYEGTDPVELDLAQLLCGILADWEIDFPEADDVFLARLKVYGDPAPKPERGVVSVLDDGRLAFWATPYLTVESDGTDYAALSDPPADRYVEHYYIPGILYFGRI